MIENVVTMKITGMRSGSVTYRNRAHVPAPSIVALSISSSGIVCSPARIVMPKNGSPRHVLTRITDTMARVGLRSEEHTSELQSRENLVCRLLLEKKKK